MLRLPTLRIVDTVGVDLKTEHHSDIDIVLLKDPTMNGFPCGLNLGGSVILDLDAERRLCEIEIMLPCSRRYMHKMKETVEPSAQAKVGIQFTRASVDHQSFPVSVDFHVKGSGYLLGFGGHDRLYPTSAWCPQ